MNRRGFMSAFTGLAAGMALDPERLLWVPGAKTISIPSPSHRKTLPELFLMSDAIWNRISAQNPCPPDRPSRIPIWAGAHVGWTH